MIDLTASKVFKVILPYVSTAVNVCKIIRVVLLKNEINRLFSNVQTTSKLEAKYTLETF